MQFETLRQVEQFAAENGIALSPADRAKITAVQESEKSRLTQLNPPAARQWADRWNSFYPALLAAIVSIGETLLTLAQTIIVSLGVPLVLVLLLIVEHQRVFHGIQLFEVSFNLASFAAWALVLLNLTLEFTVHHVESKADYHADRDTRWSLKIWSKNMAYRLGLGDNWTAVELSPAERYRRLLRLVTFTILALALAGSMRSVIDAQSGAWYTALVNILTQSTLAEITVWLGGLLFAAAAVLSAQGLSRYVAIRVVEIGSQMEKRQADDVNPYAAEIDQVGAMAALAIVNDRLHKKAVKITPVNPTPAVMELPTPLYISNHTYTNGHSVTE